MPAYVNAGLLAVATILYAANGQTAQAATVDCGSGQTISAAIAKLKPTQGYQTINVFGACSDNVFVPPDLAVSLVAAAGTTLVPANSAYATIYVEGRLSVLGFAITSGSYGVFVNRGGWTTLAGGTIEGPNTGLQVSDNGGALVQNETIDVTGYSAISLYNAGTLEVEAVAPIGSATGTTLTGAGDAINCQQGNVTLNASGGPISLANNGNDGLDSQGCTITTYVSNGQVISITNNKGVGLNADQAGSVTLAGVQITNNGSNGIYSQVGAAVQLSGADTITGNGNSAISMSKNAVLNIENFAGGVNTISAPTGNTDVLFNCYQGGKIYVDQVSGFISPPPTKANKGCLTVGGK